MHECHSESLAVVLVPKAEAIMRENKESIRNQATRLLQEFRADYDRANKEIQHRFVNLNASQSEHGRLLLEYKDLLEIHGDQLTKLKDDISLVLIKLGRHETLHADQIHHLEELKAIQPDKLAQPAVLRVDPATQKEIHMSDITNDNHTERQIEDWRSISWSSIFFGTMVALAISIMLHVLGLGVGASTADTSARAGDTLATVGGVTGIWFLASTAVSLFIGGFVASTLAHTFTGQRAAIYAFGVWALSTLITMSVLVPALVKGAGNAVTATGTIADRAGRIIGSAGGGAVNLGQNAPYGLVDRLQSTLIGTPSGQVDQNAVQDVKSLIGQRFIQGEWTSQQRDQLVSSIAKIANISPEDARRRVDEAQNTISNTVEQAQQKARQAAEVTRQAIATAAYSAFAAMLVGLLASFFGARYGELDEEHLPPFARIRFQRPEPLRR